MSTHNCASNYVLFKNLIDNQILMVDLDKCIVENDHVRCMCDGKIFNGLLLTVGKFEICFDMIIELLTYKEFYFEGSEAVCHKAMMKMNSSSTDACDSSVSEKTDEIGDQQNQLIKGPGRDSMNLSFRTIFNLSFIFFFFQL